MYYSEFTTWSPVFGCDVSRVSMVNEHGEEYFCLLPVSEGRAFVELKKRAVDVLTEAIEAGMEAGEYRWRP